MASHQVVTSFPFALYHWTCRLYEWL